MITRAKREDDPLKNKEPRRENARPEGGKAL